MKDKIRYKIVMIIDEEGDIDITIKQGRWGHETVDNINIGIHAQKLESEE